MDRESMELGIKKLLMNQELMTRDQGFRIKCTGGRPSKKEIYISLETGRRKNKYIFKCREESKL